MMHTPTPWTIESDDGIDWTVLQNQVRIAVECTENNARLIAAAPEMLHLLCVIHSNAAESPEWIRAKINAVVFDGALL